MFNWYIEAGGVWRNFNFFRVPINNCGTLVSSYMPSMLLHTSWLKGVFHFFRNWHISVLRIKHCILVSQGEHKFWGGPGGYNHEAIIILKSYVQTSLIPFYPIHKQISRFIVLWVSCYFQKSNIVFDTSQRLAKQFMM